MRGLLSHFARALLDIAVGERLLERLGWPHWYGVGEQVVEHAGTVGAAVAKGAHMFEKVMNFVELSIVPSSSAVFENAEEGAKGDDLAEHPQGHVTEVLVD